MNKYIYKIYVILLLIITCSFSFYTLLMHFKYYSTRSDLFNKRFSIVLKDLSGTIDRSRKLGINIEEIQNLNQIISKINSNYKEIEDIYIFTMQKDRVRIILSTAKKDLDVNTQNYIYSTAQRTNQEIWNFNMEDNVRFLGMNFKNPAGIIEAGVVLKLASSFESQGLDENETLNLYKRLLIGLLICAPLLFLITITSFYTFNKSLWTIQKNLDELSHDSAHFQPKLEDIENPDIRNIVAQTLEILKKTTQNLLKIESLLKKSSLK